jgi:hypothetical protein
MAKYTGMILTNNGKELLARAIIAQELITFTKAEIGNGDLLPEELPEELTGLKGSFKVLNITSTTVLEDGAFRVRVAFDNAGIVSDTYLKEIGVFARGEDGIEVLYSYCSATDPDLIPGEESGVIERVEDLITYISNATTINAIIDQSNVYATIKDLTDGLDTKENKFTKNSGFNRVKSDSVSLDDTNTIGTSKAVKIAYDKGIEAKNIADGKEPAIGTKKSGFNLEKSDIYTGNDPAVLTSQKALYDALATVLKLTGGTLTGDLTISKGTNVMSQLKFIEDGGKYGGIFQYDGVENIIKIKGIESNVEKDAISFPRNPTAIGLKYMGNQIYHEGNKPSASDIGALADSGHLLSNNGFQKLSNGLIIQWGTVSSTSDGSQSFSFPLTFPNSCFSVTFDGFAVNQPTLTTSGFTFDRWDNYGGIQLRTYIALGY